MDASAWITAASGLTGAVIGALAALLSQSLQARRQARSAIAQEHKLAIEEVLVRSQAIDLRARQAVLLSANLGSLSGLLSRILGNLAPVDLQALFDRMDAEADGLQRAAARVWLFADAETVALSNDVVLAAMDVVDAHHHPKTGRALTSARVALTGRYVADETAIADTRSLLAQARRALVRHTRTTIRLPDVDPFDST